MFSTLTLSSPAIINNLIHLYLIITLLAILFFAYVMSAEASSKAVLLGGLTVNTANIFKIFQCFMLLLLLLFKSTYFVSAGFFFSHLYACHIFYHMQIAVLFLFFFVQYLLFNIFSCTSKDRLITSIVLVVLLILLQYIWATSTIFSLIFLLDCVNLLFFILLVLDLQFNSNTTVLTKQVGVFSGIISIFWTSFIATIIFFVGGFLALEYLFTGNFSCVLLLTSFLNFEILSSSSYFNSYLIFFLLAFFLKAGLGPFFFWKYSMFANMRLCLLTIYACFYYTILILYIVRLLLSLMLFCSVSIFILFFIFLCLSIFFMIFLFDGGVRLSDFFVISTLLNTTLVFGFLTALLYTI